MNNAIYPGVTGITFTQTGTDVAQAVPAANLISAAGAHCLGAYISVVGNDLNVAFGGAVPTQADTGPHHTLSAGSSLFISSWGSIKGMQFINAANTLVGYLKVTPVF